MLVRDMLGCCWVFVGIAVVLCGWAVVVGRLRFSWWGDALSRRTVAAFLCQFPVRPGRGENGALLWRDDFWRLPCVSVAPRVFVWVPWGHGLSRYAMWRRRRRLRWKERA